MATDFRAYLATAVISEKRTISYRNIARALNLHVNAAKCMLYEFYENENKKIPGSVHATYMLSGVKEGNSENGHTNADTDSIPPSSPPPFTSSMLDPSREMKEDVIPTITVTLVREDALEEIKKEYKTITSIHLYSISPHRIQDLATLTDIGRGVFSDTFVKQDPLEYNKIYGVILNPEVRRRKGKRPVIVEAAAKFKPVKDDPKPSLASSMAKMSNGSEGKKDDSRPGSSGSIISTSTKQSLKRDASDIFKSFAKMKTPKISREDTGTSASGTDTKMTDLDDEGESQDESMFLDTDTKKTVKKRGSDAAKERADKAAKLRRMMDSDDEDESVHAKSNEAPAVTNGNDTEMVEDKDVAWSDSDTEKKPGKDNTQKEDAEAKRRRGKRKVMKKRTMKDEDGYLVTKEEVVWESFSEEEPEVKKLKSSFPLSAKTSSQTKSTAGKTANAGAKGGNIMNFFGKK